MHLDNRVIPAAFKALPDDHSLYQVFDVSPFLKKEEKKQKEKKTGVLTSFE